MPQCNDTYNNAHLMAAHNNNEWMVRWRWEDFFCFIASQKKTALSAVCSFFEWMLPLIRWWWGLRPGIMIVVVPHIISLSRLSRPLFVSLLFSSCLSLLLCVLWWWWAAAGGIISSFCSSGYQSYFEFQASSSVRPRCCVCVCMCCSAWFEFSQSSALQYYAMCVVE